MNDANKAKTRYEALNTEYKNLEAYHKDSQVDCSNHKATLDRLKKDHSRMNIEHSRNYRDLKEKNLRTIIALQNEVEKYQKQAQNMQMQIDTLQQSLSKYQNVAAKTAKNSNIISKSAGFDVQGLTEHKDNSYSRIRRRKRKIESLGNHQVPKKYGFEKNLEENESLPSWGKSSKKSNNFHKPVNTYEKIFSNINKDLVANVDHEANSEKFAERYDVINNNEREIEDTGKSNEDIVNKDDVANEDNVPNEKNFIEPHAVINHNAIENQDTINNNEDVINNVNENNENHPLQLNEEKENQEIVNVMKENMKPEALMMKMTKMLTILKLWTMITKKRIISMLITRTRKM
ncbi:GATA zinc finger domain-containing protein 14-like isoform X2 [Xenia sp. Carnegie-2017]|uniref:GATA zinc finger domain-containing protein 14-like isoform X2 n=1 Tax=Xenia sp. Carnegie-2017 TaxID=2897299 RepID=UPI001F0367B6|nr:GATA zinc finger domain-containing protein 14-like isoform X2 [Xenia sp. Carnegie-2017]